MLNMKKVVKELCEVLVETRGVTAMEYGLIAALVAVVTIAGLTTIGTNLSATFTSIGAKI